MKLSTKWKRVGIAPVYENVNGSRIHTNGLIRLKNKEPHQEYFTGETECNVLKQMGFNRKRSLMLLCEFWEWQQEKRI